MRLIVDAGPPAAIGQPRHRPSERAYACLAHGSGDGRYTGGPVVCTCNERSVPRSVSVSPRPLPPLGKPHARRLREIYRSAGWPCQDLIEVELLAAGLVERVRAASGHETLRVTDTGVQMLRDPAGQPGGPLFPTTRCWCSGWRARWCVRAAWSGPASPCAHRCPGRRRRTRRSGASPCPTCFRSATPRSRPTSSPSCTKSRCDAPTCWAT